SVTLWKGRNEHLVIPSEPKRSRGIPRCYLKSLATGFLDFARNDQGLARRGIPALPQGRAKCFAPYNQSVSRGADCLSGGKQNALEKMRRRRLSELSFQPDEAQASAFVCATAILGATHVLSIPAARKGLRTNPVREVQLPKIEKKLPLVLTRQQ